MQNQFTNDIINDDTYRLRLPSEVRTYALKGIGKTNKHYVLSDFDDVLNKSDEVGYEEVDKKPPV